MTIESLQGQENPAPESFWVTMPKESPTFELHLAQVLAGPQYNFDFLTREVDGPRSKAGSSDYLSIWIASGNAYKVRQIQRLLTIGPTVDPLPGRVVEDSLMGTVKPTFEQLAGISKRPLPLSDSDVESLFLLAAERKFDHPIGDQELAKAVPVIGDGESKVSDMIRAKRLELLAEGKSPMSDERIRELINIGVSEILSRRLDLRSSFSF